MARTKKEYQPAVFVADTETTSEADYQLDGETRVYLWNIQRVKGLDPATFKKGEMDCKEDDLLGDNMTEFFDWIEGRTNKTTYLWFYNTSFDGAFITDYALRNGYTSESYNDVVLRNNGRKEAIKKYLTENDLPFFDESTGQRTYVPRKVTKDYDVPRKSLTVIKSGSSWIMLVIINSRGHVIKVYDVGNKFTTVNGVEGIAKVLGRSGKTGLDLTKRRGLDYIATDEERERVTVDTDIIEDGIKLFYDWGMRCSTLAGDAWQDYMKMCRRYYFEEAMKELENTPGSEDLPEEFKTAIAEDVGMKKLGAVYPDKMPETFTCANGVQINIRDAYAGGVVYVNPKFEEKEVASCSVIDRNSMHPSSMKFCDMPYGIPETSVGEPKSTRYIVKFTAAFKIKKGMFPTIQKKGSIRTMDADWIYDTHGEPMELTMTDLDLKWFLASYDLDIPFDCLEKSYLNFKHKKLPVLGEYVDKWTAEKKKCKKERNKYEKGTDGYSKWDILYYRAKIMQNALYGKFGQDPIKPYQWAEIGEKDVLEIEESDTEAGEYFPAYASKYLAVACFVTAESRDSLRNAIELVKDDFVYADTDSVHFNDHGIGKEAVKAMLVEKGVWLDDAELGAWDLEDDGCKAKYLRAKTYIHEKDNKLDVKCAGMPEKMKKHVTWDNFYSGALFPAGTGKLLPRMRKGGKTLVEVDFRIKEKKHVNR